MLQPYKIVLKVHQSLSKATKYLDIKCTCPLHYYCHWLPALTHDTTSPIRHFPKVNQGSILAAEKDEKATGNDEKATTIPNILVVVFFYS